MLQREDRVGKITQGGGGSKCNTRWGGGEGSARHASKKNSEIEWRWLAHASQRWLRFRVAGIDHDGRGKIKTGRNGNGGGLSFSKWWGAQKEGKGEPNCFSRKRAEMKKKSTRCGLLQAPGAQDPTKKKWRSEKAMGAWRLRGPEGNSRRKKVPAKDCKDGAEGLGGIRGRKKGGPPGGLNTKKRKPLKKEGKTRNSKPWGVVAKKGKVHHQRPNFNLPIREKREDFPNLFKDEKVSSRSKGRTRPKKKCRTKVKPGWANGSAPGPLVRRNAESK